LAQNDSPYDEAKKGKIANVVLTELTGIGE